MTKEEAENFSNNILEEVLHGDKNIVIDAVAGAGKTRILIRSMLELPSNKPILFCAFNKKIATEVEEKIKEGIRKKNNAPYITSLPNNVRVSTCHALGKSIIDENYTRSNRPNVDEYKYKTRMYEIISEDLAHELGHNGYLSYISNISRLIDYARFDLDETIGDIQKSANHYGLNLVNDEAEIVYDLMEWGKTNLQSIDYTDMIWIPNVLNLSTEYRIEFVFIDEAQDLSQAQKGIVFKTFGPNTRFVAAGDRDQCINSWCGGDKNSFDSFLNLPNTKEFPMPVTWRCSKAVVRKAKSIVSKIEPLDDSKEGAVNYNVNPMAPCTDEDLVMCRNNAPLAHYYQQCMKFNKQVRFVDYDSEGGTTQSRWLNKIKGTGVSLLSIDFNHDGVIPRLYKEFLSDVHKLCAEKHIDEREAYKNEDIANKYDDIVALETFAEGLTTADELIAKIKGIFGDTSNSGIQLSTIHKAKGLTTRNAYILCPSLIPSKLAEKDWEIEAEKNLEYVAYTRPTDTLNFIDEKLFPAESIYSNPEKTMKKLHEIQRQLDILQVNGTAHNNRDISGTTKTTHTTKKIGGRKLSMFMR